MEEEDDEPTVHWLVGRCRLTQCEPKLKPPGTKSLKLKCNILLSSFAFKNYLCRYNKAIEQEDDETAGIFVIIKLDAELEAVFNVGRCMLSHS